MNKTMVMAWLKNFGVGCLFGTILLAATATAGWVLYTLLTVGFKFFGLWGPVGVFLGLVIVVISAHYACIKTKRV